MIVQAGIKWGMIGALAGTTGGIGLGFLERTPEAFLTGIVIGYIGILTILVLTHFILKKTM